MGIEKFVKVHHGNKLGGKEVPTISARELHKFLKVREPYEQWIERRIKEGGYVEGKDYVTSTIYEDDSNATK